MTGETLHIILQPEMAEVQSHSYTCYVANPPTNVRGVLAENVFSDLEGQVYVARVYRPLTDGKVPTATSFQILDKCIQVTYSDGCVVYSYLSDIPPDEEHRMLDRYCDDDMFLLNSAMNEPPPPRS